MAPSVELVHRFRPWCAVWPPKIDPKAAQHEKPGDEDEPVSALPPDASRRRIFAHGNQDLLLPSKTSELYTLLLLSSRAKPRDLLLAFVAQGFPRARRLFLPACGKMRRSHPGCLYGTRFGLAASKP